MRLSQLPFLYLNCQAYISPLLGMFPQWFPSFSDHPHNVHVVAGLDGVHQVILQGDPDAPWNSSKSKICNLLLNFYLLIIIYNLELNLCYRNKIYKLEFNFRDKNNIYELESNLCVIGITFTSLSTSVIRIKLEFNLCYSNNIQKLEFNFCYK